MLYVTLDMHQRSWWYEYGCRYALALIRAGVPLRIVPYGKDVVERTNLPEEFYPLLDTMLGPVELCTSMLYIGEPAGAVELVSRGPGEVAEEKYALITWPTDSMPAGIVAGLNCYDAIIVPTESCQQVLRRSGLTNVVVVPPPDPPLAEEPDFEAPYPMALAMGTWGGLDCSKAVLLAFAGQFSRKDGCMIHVCCPDAPFDDGHGLEWECAGKPPEELPVVSLSLELLDAVGRSALLQSAHVYVSASRRMDFDPFVREAIRAGVNAVAPTCAVERGLPDAPLWTVPSLPCGAEECGIRGVGPDQMWGDVDGADIGPALGEAFASRAPFALPAERTMEETGKRLAKTLTRVNRDEVALGGVSLRVVIPHRDRGLEFVKPCLDALLSQLGPLDVVYLVDQESRPEIFNNVLVYCINRGVSVVPSEPGPGGVWSLASARNVGASFSDGTRSTHVFFLDCDCVVPDGFVASLKECLAESPAAIQIPRVMGSETGQERPATGLAAMSLKLYADVGGYDEGYYGWGSEDVDFLWRARRRFGANGLLLKGDALVIKHIDHPPCADQDEHGVRNTQRFEAMAGDGGHL